MQISLRLLMILGPLAWAVQDAPPLPEDRLPAEMDRGIPLGLDPEKGRRHAHSEAEIALGRKLFFDPVLSEDGTVSCASCHDPAHGFTTTAPVAVGIQGRAGHFNAPTLFNRAWGDVFLWDGRAASLEEQVLMPIANPREMGSSVEHVLERLGGNAAMVQAFDAAFEGAEPSLTPDHLARALAAFVRSLTHADSAVDRFQAGEASALNEAEQAGLWIYESSGRCWRCHSGSNFSDEAFHNTGVGLGEDGQLQPGRSAVTEDPSDRGAFKTPTLRGLVHTAPYMHDGSLATLEEVVEFYRQGGHPNEHLDERMQPLDLSDRDASNLVAFLKALSGPSPTAVIASEQGAEGR